MSKAFFTAMAVMMIAIAEIQASDLRICKPVKLENGGEWESICMKLLKHGDKEKGFLLTGTSLIQEQTEYNKFAASQTEFTSGYDGHNLYLAIRCYDSRGNNLTARCTEPDGPVWRDDSIEIFIAPQYKGTDYYQLVVNPLKTMYDGHGSDRNWNCDWKVKILYENDAWVVLCAIPFNAVAVKASGNALAGFNVCRSRYAGNIKELSSWAYASSGFHNTNEFGVLVIGDSELSLRNFIKLCRERRDSLLFKFDEKRNAESPALQRIMERMKSLLAETDARLAETEQPGLGFEKIAELCSQINALLNEYEAQRDEYKNQVNVVKATLWL